MTEAAAQLVALRHYRTKWLAKTWDEIAAEWQTEYDAVASGTFTPLRIRQNAGDGWSAAAEANFEQPLRLAALMEFRASKDEDYRTEVFAPSTPATDGPSVMLPVFSPRCFPH